MGKNSRSFLGRLHFVVMCFFHSIMSSQRLAYGAFASRRVHMHYTLYWDSQRDAHAIMRFVYRIAIIDALTRSEACAKPMR